jgi:hypothetical protein
MPPRKRLGQVDLFSKRVRMTAAEHQRTGSEFQLACSVADLLRKGIAPGWNFSHFPAGEQRPRAAAIRLLRMGLKRGWSDLILLSPLPATLAHFLELKRGREGELSEDQEAFQRYCVTHGYPHEVARTLDEALTVLRRWGALRGIT